ncbi:MAG TPA: pyridoxal-phosphate dependent enzyme [Acidobacteriota bacterium]|nr:pyridoxal-phosphate dependent enzyme [Acidobacteriota bacterium]
MDILNAIGNTSLVRLRKVVPPNCVDILVKLEWENPSGSVKDRMARRTYPPRKASKLSEGCAKSRDHSNLA